jgi:WD40 repeat protein/transcriptional regulator with XRE-family HTH domain
LVRRGAGEAAIDTPAEFARELDALRRASGKSYRQLAAECGLGFNTVAGYCAGRHLPQLSVQAQFQQLLAALGVPAGAARDDWCAALAGLRARSRPIAASTWNPYRGLRAFESSDAAVFFGRQELTARLLTELDRCRESGTALVVVGPSGSGKSSLLRAGLLAAVESAVLVTPGAEPLRQWTQRAPCVADDAVVVIDQFEELFTLCTDEGERVGFLTAVLERRAPVVVGLRADFYGHALRYPQLAALFQRSQIVVEPMTEAQLREAIVEPARSAGLELESGLVELLLRDTAREPAALPLLSHTLRTVVELAQACDPPAAEIGVTHYRAVGGVHGAVATTAEQAYQSLTVDQRQAARRLFLRLVRTDDSTADTRRRVTFDELVEGRPASEADEVAEVLDVFVTHRLLTTGPHTAEIGHEALLAAWPRLADWLAEDRAGHHLHGRLTAAARSWRADGRPAEGLYQGGALAGALEWALEPGPSQALNPLEREFLAASVAARAARAATERRRMRRAYQLVSALMVLVLIAAGTAFYARQVTTGAQREARFALSRQIAATADRLRAKDPALAAQFALVAYRTAPTPQARSAVLESSATPVPRRSLLSQAGTAVLASAGALSATGTVDGQVQLWRTTADGAPAPAGPRLTIGHAVAVLALSRDATLLAAADQDGSVWLWRVSDPGHPVALRLPAAGAGRVFTLAFSPDGGLLAAGAGDANTYLWQLDAQSPPRRLGGARKAVKSVAFTADGRVLAAAGDDGTVRLWSVPAPTGPTLLGTLGGPTGEIFAIAISPDSRTLAAGTAADHAVYLWDITDPARPSASGAPLTGPASWINTVAFSPDGTTLTAGSSDTLSWQWDLASRRLTGTLPHPAPVTTAVYRDAHTLQTLAGDGTVRTWTLPGPVLTGSTQQVFSVSFDAAGSRLLVGAGDGSLSLWDTTDPTHPLRAAAPVLGDGPGLPALGGASALTPDGGTELGGATDGTIRCWDVTDPAHPRIVGTPLPVAHATIEAIAVSRDGTAAAVSSDDGSVHLLDLSDRAHPVVTAALTGPAGAAYGVRFSPDGHLLAVAGGDAKGYLWRVQDRAHPQLLTTVTGLRAAAYSTAFSPDGRLLAFGTADSSVRLVDLTRPQQPTLLPAPLVGPVGEVYELAFSPGRDLLAVSSVDGSIWLWQLGFPPGEHLAEPVLLATLQTAAGGLFSVAFGPDGHTLAGGGSAGTVQLWDTDPGSVAAWICTRTGDPITPAEWDRFIPGHPFDPPCR